MVNQTQANQTTTQVQHTQSPQQSQSPQQQAKTQILQQFTPSIQLQSTSGTGQQQYGNQLAGDCFVYDNITDVDNIDITKGKR